MKHRLELSESLRVYETSRRRKFVSDKASKPLLKYGFVLEYKL